jgi:hypothetical protein
MPVVEDRPQHTPKGHPHRWMGQREGFKPISSSLGCVFPRNQRFVFECALFEDIKPGARLRGLDPAGIAEVVQVARFGPDALNLVFRVDGRVGERLVYRGEESGFEFLEAGRSYAFDADGGLLRLASEAYRIRLAYLFDPYLAVSASQIEALPHQITAVYGEMLPRQPLRFNAVVTELQRTQGAKVTLTLDIKAEAPKGFAESDVSVVRDNARQLKFKAESTGFED